MKEIEKLTTKLAKQLCKDRHVPTAMWKLTLREAYNLVYFGDKDELERLARRAKAEKEFADLKGGGMNSIELIEDNILQTTRTQVPGGWIYRSYDKSHGIMGMTFVPEPQGGLRKLVLELSETLKLIALPSRPNGRYDSDRESCELLAKSALNKIREYGI